MTFGTKQSQTIVIREENVVVFLWIPAGVYTMRRDGTGMTGVVNMAQKEDANGN